MLAVVEHDEHVLELEGVEQGVEHRPTGSARDPEHLADGRRDGPLL